jgi:Na+/phosphate symporter
MPPPVRKAMLTAHVSVSVGWLGAVVASLALAVAALVGDDPKAVHAAYLALDVLGWTVLVPLSVASLLTGLVQSLGTQWGLLRHYWVVFKLLINIVATVVLLLYTQTLAALAGRPVSGEVLGNPSPVVHAGAGLVLLLLAVILSIYKPRALTPYGHR